MTSTSFEHIPYESASRLQDRKQRADLSRILGLDSESLTNANLQPVPRGAGAGRVKAFQEPTAPRPGRDGNDIEMQPPSTTSGPSQAGLIPSKGYPDFANFVASDRDFFIFRKFSQLSARNLLYMQDELAELEHKLRLEDIRDSRSDDAKVRWNLHSRREDGNIQRAMLMRHIETRLSAYHKALHHQAKLFALESPSETQLANVVNWIQGFKPVSKVESHIFDIKADLVSVGGQESSKELLERFLEDNWYQYFRTSSPDTVVQTDDAGVEYYSFPAIRKVSRAILTFLANCFLLIPLIVLYNVTSPLGRLSCIGIFASGFAAILCLLTQSRTFEIFAAMAAYAAFLVVFVATNH